MRGDGIASSPEESIFGEKERGRKREEEGHGEGEFKQSSIHAGSSRTFWRSVRTCRTETKRAECERSQEEAGSEWNGSDGVAEVGANERYQHVPLLQ